MNNGVLLLFGLGIVGGLLSALLAKKIKVPQVIGFIIAGLILGQSGLKIVTSADIASLDFFNNFALGIIGFLVGSELKFETLKKYAPQFSSLLISEGMAAFILVTLLTGGVLYAITKDSAISISGGIVLGAIASATDPASTISVLWEKRAAGILTTTIIAIIALDDALAMVLYGIGSGVSEILTGAEGASIGSEILRVVISLSGSVLLGVIGGYIITFIMKRPNLEDQEVPLSLGIILLILGLSVRFDFDIAIVAITVGIILANIVPLRSEKLIGFFKTISLPIYSIFFVLIGARISIGSMPSWLWGIIVLYVVGRSLGKYFGARFGAKISKADMVVQKYTGLGLFAQGGVAIGLSVVAASHLTGIKVTNDLALSDVIVYTVATTTLIVQIVGPFATALATKLSGEENKNITEEDIIEHKKIKDVVSSIAPIININSTVSQLFELFTKTDVSFIPVVDKEGTFISIVTLEQVRELFLDPDCWDWVIVSDIISTNGETLNENEPLKGGLSKLHQMHKDQLPVIDENNKYVGVLDLRLINAFVRTEMVTLSAN